MTRWSYSSLYCLTHRFRRTPLHISPGALPTGGITMSSMSCSKASSRFASSSSSAGRPSSAWSGFGTKGAATDKDKDYVARRFRRDGGSNSMTLLGSAGRWPNFHKGSFLTDQLVESWLATSVSTLICSPAESIKACVASDEMIWSKVLLPIALRRQSAR